MLVKFTRRPVAAVIGLLVLMTCAMQMAQAAVGFRSVVGTTAASGNAFTFVIGGDCALYLKVTPINPGWVNLGGCTAMPIGVTETHGNTPFAFVVGTDGNLWVNHWNGSGWPWNNLGKPTTSGVGIKASVGVVTTENNNPYVFVVGTDNALWVCHWNGSGWPWNNLGGGIVKPIGAVTVAGNIPNIYVIGGDGNIWRSSWNGSGWPWQVIGRPSSGASIIASMGVENVNNVPYVWVAASDGLYKFNGTVPNSGFNAGHRFNSIAQSSGIVDQIVFFFDNLGEWWYSNCPTCLPPSLFPLGTFGQVLGYEADTPAGVTDFGDGPYDFIITPSLTGVPLGGQLVVGHYIGLVWRWTALGSP